MWSFPYDGTREGHAGLRPRAQGAGGLPMPDVKALVFDTRGDELTAHRQIRYPDGTRAPLWGWVHGGRV
jgi:hypothetical protein